MHEVRAGVKTESHVTLVKVHFQSFQFVVCKTHTPTTGLFVKLKLRECMGTVWCVPDQQKWVKD